MLHGHGEWPCGRQVEEPVDVVGHLFVFEGERVFFGIVADEWPSVSQRLQELIDERSGVPGKA